jgi:ATP synthase protein I
MEDFKAMYFRQRKYMYFLLSFYTLGWGFTSYKTIFLGLILGTALSLFNLWLLAKRTDKFGEAVIKGKKPKNLGMLIRMAVAVLAVTLALDYPEYFNLYSVILGLMTSYIVIMIDFFIQSLHNRK